MNASNRASVLLAAAFACTFSWGAAASRADPPVPDGTMPSPPAVAELVNGLEDWLDRESPYQRRNDPVTLRLVGPQSAALSATMSAFHGVALRGYYDPEHSTIYLVEPWSPDSAYDVSILLHEFVHHRQQSVTYWECSSAQERPAYRLQDRWLRERGLDSHFNWLAVLMASHCRSGPFGGD